jgi:hypothetical protein
VERALRGGLAADRLAWACASGYRAALRALVPELGETAAALCATEKGGAHPRHIETRLCDGRLDGTKGFATLSTVARTLLVLACEGESEDGRKRLRLVRVDAAAPGVTLNALPPTPFAPELPHAEVRLDGVAVAPDEVLDGDAWTRHVRPFRTIEDLHVFAALTGYLIGVARRTGWPAELLAELTCIVSCALSLERVDRDAPATHVALGGLLLLVRRFVDGSDGEWARVDEPERERWRRDRPLLQVAGRARSERLSKALSRLRGEPAPAR